MLKCNVKGIENGYPLRIEADEVGEVGADNPFDVVFMRGLLKKVNMGALKSAAANLGIDTLAAIETEGTDGGNLEAILADESLLQQIHHLLFEIHVETGRLICPESGRVFIISDGVPNMLLHEDEIN